MFIKGVENNDKYYISLHEKKWYYFLLGINWFIPHRAYKVLKRDKVVTEKQTVKNSIGIGLAIGLASIFTDYYIQIESSYLPESIVTFLSIIVFPLIILMAYLISRYYSKLRRNRFQLDYDDFIIVKVKLFSLKTLKVSILRILLAIYLMYQINPALHLKISIVILYLPGLMYIIYVLLHSLGFYLSFYTEDDREYIIDLG